MKNKMTRKKARFFNRIHSDAEKAPFNSLVWFEWRRIKRFGSDVGKVWKEAAF